mgnify:CR=1 FL=1
MNGMVIGRPGVLESLLYCRARRKKLSLDKCMSDFVDANAFGKRGIACWRCPQGKANRSGFCIAYDGDEDDDGLVLAPRELATPSQCGRPSAVPRPGASAPPRPLPQPPAESPQPQIASPASDPLPPPTETAPQGKDDTMKPTEGTKRMLLPDRVRLAWTNTPGKTAEEKLGYVFNRHATDALQKIFGLGSAGSAYAFMVKLVDEDMINEDDHCWANDMSNYTGESGGSGDDDDSGGGQANPPVFAPPTRRPMPGPRPRPSP